MTDNNNDKVDAHTDMSSSAVDYKGDDMQGNNILRGLEEQEYANVVDMLEKAILATDLALYFQ